MKIHIELEPEELAQFLSAYAISSHTYYRANEEKLVEMMLNASGALNNKDKPDTKEVPIGGYFH